jgi:hypothetical protein
MLTDELRLHASTTQNIGIEELLSRRQPAEEAGSKVLLIDERQQSSPLAGHVPYEFTLFHASRARWLRNY